MADVYVLVHVAWENDHYEKLVLAVCESWDIAIAERDRIREYDKPYGIYPGRILLERVRYVTER